MDQDRPAGVSTRIATEGSRPGTVGSWYRGDELTEKVVEDAEGAIRRNESS